MTPQRQTDSVTLRRDLAVAPGRQSFIVIVDRSEPLVYPSTLDGTGQIPPKYPELAEACPDQFDLAKLELWLHDDQLRAKGVSISYMYDYLRKGDLKRCLGLREGMAIKKVPVEMFRHHARGRVLFLPRSTAEAADDESRHMPYLAAVRRDVVLGWADFGLTSVDIAHRSLLFAKAG